MDLPPLYLQMTPALRIVKTRLEENTGLQFNSVLANLYRDGHDSVAWHSDNEGSLGDNPTIASISLGDMRMFEMRQNPPAVRTQAQTLSLSHSLSLSLSLSFSLC